MVPCYVFLKLCSPSVTCLSCRQQANDHSWCEAMPLGGRLGIPPWPPNFVTWWQHCLTFSDCFSVCADWNPTHPLGRRLITPPPGSFYCWYHPVLHFIRQVYCLVLHYFIPLRVLVDIYFDSGQKPFISCLGTNPPGDRLVQMKPGCSLYNTSKVHR